jgi:hypothetical protein
MGSGTYEYFEDIDLVYECSVVFYFALLNGFYREQFFGFAMLSQVDNTKTTISKLFFKMVLLLNVSLVAVNKHCTLRLV